MSKIGQLIIQAAKGALAYAPGERTDAQLTRLAVRRKEAIERGEMGTVSHEEMVEEFAPDLRVFPSRTLRPGPGADEGRGDRPRRAHRRRHQPGRPGPINHVLGPLFPTSVFRLHVLEKPHAGGQLHFGAFLLTGAFISGGAALCIFLSPLASK